MNIQDVTKVVESVLSEMRHRPVPIGISNRHIHLSQKAFDHLFPGQKITEHKPLRQPGHYAAQQTLTIVGPKGKIDRVRILGPIRKATQVEISKTDARTLGIPAPIHLSGNLEKTPGIKLVSDHAELVINQGVIVARRHIHMSPLDALIYGVQHGDSVSVAIEGSMRPTILQAVSIRVSPDVVLEMHIDTDEANAADADHSEAYAKILGVSS